MPELEIMNSDDKRDYPPLDQSWWDWFWSFFGLDVKGY